MEGEGPSRGPVVGVRYFCCWPSHAGKQGGDLRIQAHDAYGIRLQFQPAEQGDLQVEGEWGTLQPGEKARFLVACLLKCFASYSSAGGRNGWK